MESRVEDDGGSPEGTAVNHSSEKISICSLIYKSKTYADSTWESLHENTPELHDGRARFFFVANDASEEIISHLEEKKYPHVIHKNNPVGDYDPPAYMQRVYGGWNRAIRESEEQCVLVNSDHMFSPGWLEGLWFSPRAVVTSKLIERRHPKYGTFERAIEQDFGDRPSRFEKEKFLTFVNNVKRNDSESGGAYMPCAFMRSQALKAGLYPEGNPIGTFGDKEFFRRLSMLGVKHYTSLKSLVYHFKEGEMSE